MPEQFQVGNLVQYSENGPKLVVESTSTTQGYLVCVWFDKNKCFHRDNFLTISLKATHGSKDPLGNKALEGNVVRFQIGDFSLLIEKSIDDGECYQCSWFDESRQFHREVFKQELLTSPPEFKNLFGTS